MPYTPSLPTWLAINNVNSPSADYLFDQYSGQPVAAGGLNLGCYFDLTNLEAANASYATNGILYAGRFRYVYVDSGATAANVKTGTVGYLKAGGNSGEVKTVVITNAGTGATANTYSIAATGGGGSGAIAQVIVGSGGTITGASILNGGTGYTSVPTFTLTATGTSGGAIAGQLDTSPNAVTSYDVSTIGRPVVFLNSITPGNYGFIQELGTATVLGNGTIGSGAAAGNWVESTTGGTVNAPSATASPTTATIGIAIDLPLASNLFKVQLTGPVVQD